VIGFFQRWNDARYYRQQKRRRTEEIMGWLCLPVFLFIGWVGFSAFQQFQADRSQDRQIQPTQQAAPVSLRR
jgi:hypothetical protein